MKSISRFILILTATSSYGCIHWDVKSGQPNPTEGRLRPRSSMSENGVEAFQLAIWMTLYSLASLSTIYPLNCRLSMFLRKKKKQKLNHHTWENKQQKKAKMEENSVTALPGGSEKYITEVLAFQWRCWTNKYIFLFVRRPWPIICSDI